MLKGRKRRRETEDIRNRVDEFGVRLSVVDKDFNQCMDGVEKKIESLKDSVLDLKHCVQEQMQSVKDNICAEIRSNMGQILALLKGEDQALKIPSGSEGTIDNPEPLADSRPMPILSEPIERVSMCVTPEPIQNLPVTPMLHHPKPAPCLLSKPEKLKFDLTPVELGLCPAENGMPFDPLFESLSMRKVRGTVRSNGAKLEAFDAEAMHLGECFCHFEAVPLCDEWNEQTAGSQFVAGLGWHALELLTELPHDEPADVAKVFVHLWRRIFPVLALATNKEEIRLM